MYFQAPMTYCPVSMLQNLPQAQTPAEPRHFMAGNSRIGYSGQKSTKEEALEWLKNKTKSYSEYSPFFLYEAVEKFESEMPPLKQTALVGYKQPVVKQEEDDDEDF